MARPNTPPPRSLHTGDDGFCRDWPEVSVRERDFWRRAVAEERERLDLVEHSAAAPGRPDVH